MPVVKIIILINIINIQFYHFTFLAPPLKGKINEPFSLEEASNLTHEFFYDNFAKFLCKDYHAKLMCQTWCIFTAKQFIFFVL